MNGDTDVGQHVFWIASRASGVVAIVMLTFTVIVGLMAGGRLFPGVKTRDLTRLHEFSSLASIFAIAAHGLLLLGDGYLNPSLADILVPFQIDYRPVYTGLGIVAGWVTLVLGLSYYVRNRVGAARWKKLHRFIIVAFALSVAHVLGAGTDATSAWLKYPLLAGTALVVILFLARVSASPGTAAPRRPQRSAAPRSARGQA